MKFGEEPAAADFCGGNSLDNNYIVYRCPDNDNCRNFNNKKELVVQRQPVTLSPVWQR